MECTICRLRSAAESCVECHELLCEECGSHCEECNATVCEDHLYRTRRGKILCPECTAALEEAPFERAAEELEDELAGLDEPDDRS